MAQPILIKRSSVPAKVPGVADLQLGELAINTADGKVYLKKDNGTASIVQIGGDNVTSFNTRQGAVTLSSSDVTTALGYTPSNSAGAGAPNGSATLDSNGKLLSAQLPALSITDTYVVASQAAMLALSAAEKGDVAVRTDVNKSFILKGTSYSTLADWQELLTPTDVVTTVAGRTGNVTLNVGDVAGAAGIAAANTFTGLNTFTDTLVLTTQAQFQGNAIVPTVSAGSSNQQIANTSYVMTAINTAHSQSAGYYLKLDGSNAMTGQVVIAGGSAAAPSIRSSSSANTGMWTSVANTNINFAVNGSNSLVVGSSVITALNPVQTPRGTAAAPTYAFSADTNTGMYCQTEDSLSFATGGIERVMISTNNVAINLNINTSNISSTGNISATGTLSATGAVSGGTLVATNSSTSKSVVISDAAGTFRTLWWNSGANNRFNLHVDNSTESGSSAGSNMNLMAISDTNVQSTVFSVNRASQVLTFSKSPIAPTPATSDNSTQLATTAYVKAQGYITSASSPVQSVAGRTGAVTLAQADIAGLTTASSPSFQALSVNARLSSKNLAFDRAGSSSNGIAFYNSVERAWCMYIGPTGDGQGPTGAMNPSAGTLVTGWALRSSIQNEPGYGWTFESGTLSSTTPTIKAEISAVDGAARFGGNVSAPTFTGAGTGLTGTAPSLSIGGNAATATTATNVTNLSSGQVTTALGYAPYNATTNLLYFQGKGADIPASADFDAYVTHGVYYQNSDAQAATCLNAPIGISGKLTVTTGNTSIGYWQEYETYKHNNNRTRTFKRQRYSSVWSAWTEVAAVDLVPAVNPVTPKDGDIKVEAGPIISIYAATAWRQIFPAVYA